jgi:hypothetical protein
MPRPRQAVAAACIALVVISAVLPLGGQSFEWLAFTPAFVLLPAPVTVAIRFDPPCRREQPTALLSLCDVRGPPRPSFP